MSEHMIIVLLVNASVLLLAYSWIYPRFAGDDVQRMSLIDLGLSGVTLAINGVIFFGSGLEFNVFGLAMNWFFFGLISYFLLEIPPYIYYLTQRRQLRESLLKGVGGASADDQVRAEMADTRWDAVRVPRRQRQLAAAGLVNLVVTPLLIVWVGFPALLGVLLHFVLIYLLHRSTRLITEAHDHMLDERQLAQRNHSYYQAYRVLSTLVVILAMAVIFFAAGSDFLADESLQYYDIRVSWDQINAFFWAGLMATATLPAALLAWREGGRRSQEPG